MRVDFYHLTRQPLERVLPQIAERVLAADGRLLVVAEDPDQRARLDGALWTYAPDSFLPHGRIEDGAAADQPVLIAADPAPANGARHVLLADGRWRDEALAFERAFHFFDDEAIEGARAAWRALGARDGVERHYWRQKEEGGWERVA